MKIRILLFSFCLLLFNGCYGTSNVFSPNFVSQNDLNNDDFKGLQFYIDKMYSSISGESLIFEISNEEIKKENNTLSGIGNYQLTKTQYMKQIEIPLRTPGVCIKGAWNLITVDFGDDVILDFAPGEAGSSQSIYALKSSEIVVNGIKYKYKGKSLKTYYLQATTYLHLKKNTIYDKNTVKGKKVN